jgi:AraC-like DNA-binding protein
MANHPKTEITFSANMVAFLAKLARFSRIAARAGASVSAANRSRLRDFERHSAGRYLERILALVGNEPLQEVRAAFAQAGLDYDRMRRAPDEFLLYDLYVLLHALNRDEKFPGICLRFGLARDLLDLGVLGYTILSCQDLGTAAKIIVKYHRLTSDAFDVTLTRDGNRTFIRQWVKPQHVERRVVIDEEHVTGIRVVLHSLLPDVLIDADIEIQLAHSEPSYGELYRELLPCKLSFGTQETFVAFPTEWLGLPLQTAADTVEAVCESQCDLVLNELNPSDRLVDDLRRLMLAVPANRALKLEDCARKMLLSARTLERRLQTAGTSFRNVDNEIRMQLAAQYLSLGYLSNKEIAHMLNYSQPSTFYRAFKNWHGVTPKEFRAEQNPALASRRH